jgi:hypothetical protein
MYAKTAANARLLMSVRNREVGPLPTPWNTDDPAVQRDKTNT